MKESEFIEQNKQKWVEFEQQLQNKNVDPAQKSKLFVQITDDLSYARTFYKNRSVRLYLNGIAKLLFNDLNRTQAKSRSLFAEFWKKELPLTMFQARRAMLISFLVFVACFTLGVVTSVHDKDFARSILSSHYVEMTNENIEKGDPMAVYKQDSEMNTFLPILYNNLRVDFMTFFSGIFMAVGSLVIMIYNGIMVGVFQYFFIERGLFWPSFLTIWTHGALEISTIILSGGAGLTLGKGLLFPGTLSRFQAFKLSGMQGLKIILGVAPITFLAAFIEGFLTRHTDIPDVIRLIFILLSFAFILVYFFYYPRKVVRQYGEPEPEEDKALVYKEDVPFDPSEIYGVNKLITETFRHFFTGMLFFGRWLLLVPLISAILVAVNPYSLFREYAHLYFSGKDFVNYSEYPAMGILSFLNMAAFLLFGLQYLRKQLLRSRVDENSRYKSFFQNLITSLVVSAIYILMIATDLEYSFVAAVLILPFLILLASVAVQQNISFLPAINSTVSLLNQSWIRFFAGTGLMYFLIFVFYLASSYGVRVLFISEALVWILTDDETTAAEINLALYVFQTFLSFMLFLGLCFVNYSLLFYTLKEALTAEHLIARIKAIKTPK